jgi:hypothetical protein
LAEAAVFTAEEWKAWQGTYFSCFFIALLSPLNGFGRSQLAVVMVFNVLLFFAAVTWCAYEVQRCISPKLCGRALLVLAAFWGLLMGYKIWGEVFYWFTGAMVYSFPLAFAFLAMAALLRARRKNRKGWYPTAWLFAFCASGGNLMISGMLCYALLLMNLYLFWREKHIGIGEAVAFGTAFLGALINTIAPGNYLRHGCIDNSGLHVGSALLTSVGNYIKEAQWLFQSTFVLLAICGMVYLGATASISLCEKGASRKKVWLTAICALLAVLQLPLVTTFPVALGYSSNGLPNRCEFMLDCALILVVLLTSYILGLTLKQLLFTQERRLNRPLAQIVLAGLLAAYILTMDYGVRTTVPFRTFTALTSGTLQAYSREYGGFLMQQNGYEVPGLNVSEAPEPLDIYISTTN